MIHHRCPRHASRDRATGAPYPRTGALSRGRALVVSLDRPEVHVLVDDIGSPAGHQRFILIPRSIRRRIADERSSSRARAHTSIALINSISRMTATAILVFPANGRPRFRFSLADFIPAPVGHPARCSTWETRTQYEPRRAYATARGFNWSRKIQRGQRELFL
jgi:hypothetical protein